MAWVAVDKDGTEKIMSGKPIRRNEIVSVLWGLIKCLPSPYSKSQRHKWASQWSIDPNDPLPEGAIELPKGTIRKLIGRDLSWKDEPVELKE